MNAPFPSLSARRLFLLAGSLIALLPWPLAAAEPDRPPAVESSLDVMIPGALRELLLDDPSVRFWVTVDADGRLADYLALEATHVGLLERAEETLAAAKFSAARVQGQPVLATAEVRVTFFDPVQRALRNGSISQPFVSSVSDVVNRRIYEGSKDHYVFRQSTPAELDAPPQVQDGRLMVLLDADGRPAAGQCVIDFYIDHHGKVRMPRVVSADNETVSRSALLTLLQMKYSPPTHHGAPTCVKVRMPLIYGDAKKS